MQLSNLPQLLADLPMRDIATFAIILTLVRLALVRIPAAAARAFSEVLEAALIAVVLVFMIIQPFVMKTFYIPSGSMLPTLIDDDHIVVNKLGFRLHAPHDDDVVVFVAPPQALEESPDSGPSDGGPTYYIKRLIGRAGEVITASRGYVEIDGREFSHTDIRRQFGVLDQDKQHVKIEANDLLIYETSWKRYTATQVAAQFDEPGQTVVFHPGVTYRNGQPLSEPFIAEDPDYDLKIVDGHSVRFDDVRQTRVDGADPTPQQSTEYANAKPGPVPAGDVFVMGDNRNDSNDSTYWGPLQANRLVGRASAIFWPVNRMHAVR